MNPFGDDDEKEGVKQAVVIPDDDHPASVDEGEDPLDRFMESLESAVAEGEGTVHIPHIVESDDDDDDNHHLLTANSHVAATDPRSHAQSPTDDDEKSNHAKRNIEYLPPVDHSLINYPSFKGDCYREHGSITLLPHSEVLELRKTLGVSVSGFQIPKCVCSFAHFNLPESILSVLRDHDYSAPTPVQAQAIPCALSGRDVIGIAMTGSGKTLAYIIPVLVHVLENQQTTIPRVIIVCPTRELAIQIEQEIYRFSKKVGSGFTSVALTGGLSKYEQFKLLAKGCDVVVGNPGRIVDLVQMKKGLDLSGVSMCVLDEADRMFKMGFENQLRAIIQQIRPDRQMLMFSATMPPHIERLAREVLSDPIRVVVGSIGQAASVIDQNVFICHSEGEKKVWLEATLPSLLVNGGRTLIFVNSKSAGDELGRWLKAKYPAGIAAIHGDLDQDDRMRIMTEFKAGKIVLLVATDVAARGIDVAGVTCVIEYEPARDFDTHTHRIGRTGRAGVAGTSWTLLSEHDSKLSAHIVESIEALGQKNVNHDLLQLAMNHPPFRAARVVSGRHRAGTEEDEVEKWEPLKKHFKKGQTENIESTSILDEERESTNSEGGAHIEYAPGVTVPFGKLSVIDSSDRHSSSKE